MLRRCALALFLCSGLAWAAPEPGERDYPNSLKLTDLSSWVREQNLHHHGFLSSGRAGFRWKDGSRARFWGVNIANRNLWIERAEIDRVVDRLAASGVNLVRFEALDSRGGILEIPGSPGTRRLNPDKLDTLHYWISRLHRKHICYYLDLIDFREFTPEDGVENAKALTRAGRPYAMFDSRLIELQKEYARQLLTTVNPYTRSRPVDDPALVLLEICNESGFWLHAKTTDNLIEPYRGRFQKRWNEWLLDRYGRRAELASSWGAVLGPEESPESGTVRLPQLQKPDSGARQRDGVEFLQSVERVYFADMRDALRDMGLRIPITAVVSSDVPAELEAVARELDFVSENHYADHPAFGGTDWQGKFFYNNKNALRDDSRYALPPFTAQLRWESKPVVVREWASVWPNQFRAGSVPEAAAYARLQDFDAMILFGYKTGEVGTRLVEFGYQVDPPVWDLFGLGALLFLRGDIETPEQLALLEYSDSQLLKGVAGDSDLIRLAHSLRIASCRTEGDAPVGDLTVFPVGESNQNAQDWLRQAGLFDGSAYRSANGQIRRDVAQGRLTLNAPALRCVAGELGGAALEFGDVRVQTQTPLGALWIASLDGQPLDRSRRWLAKAVSVAENTGQKLIPAGAGAPAALVLDQPGAAPVLTRGSLRPGATRIRLWNNEELVVNQLNGTWEFLSDHGRGKFWSDTPGATAEFAGAKYGEPLPAPAAQPGQPRGTFP